MSTPTSARPGHGAYIDAAVRRAELERQAAQHGVPCDIEVEIAEPTDYVGRLIECVVTDIRRVRP